MKLNSTKAKRITISSLIIISICLISSLPINAEDKQKDQVLLDQYIISMGHKEIINFDASNIKQFWTDSAVFSKDNCINIVLSSNNNTNGHESIPLKIQLANVNETMDCIIEVISETRDIAFSVLDNTSKVLSKSKNEDAFLNYSITSSAFHLENTQKNAFMLKFSSKTANILSIKNIILSFRNNQGSSFLASPGVINYANTNIKTTSTVSPSNDKSFSVTGKQTAIVSEKKILVTDNTLISSVTVKNIGDSAATIYVGYGTYTQDNVFLSGRNYPASDKIMRVVSSQEGNNTIIVDSYSEWSKGYYLALNAREDMSDIPNQIFADGMISEIRKLDNGNAEIVMDKPLKSKIKEGTEVRVHGKAGSYLYLDRKKLLPGEEHSFTCNIKKNELFLKYSPEAFSRGVYYVVPIILSYSVDKNEDNTVLISDYSISY